MIFRHGFGFRMVLALGLGWVGLRAESSDLFPNGIASGDPTATSIVLWARSTEIGPVVFEYTAVARHPGGRRDFSSPILGRKTVEVVSPDLPVKVEIKRLLPGCRYRYRVIHPSGESLEGSFETARPAWRKAGFRFGVSGDWRGELAPYPAVSNATERDLDLFVALGDTIYADYPSPAVPAPQAVSLTEYRLKHSEVYSNRFGLNAFADLRRSVAWMAMIDDHEVINDFAGGAPGASDPRLGEPGTPLINETLLYRNGLQAFHEFNPIRAETYRASGSARFDGKPKLYRSQQFGRDAALFILDARSFRDTALPNAANPLDPDQAAAFLVASADPSRTMLGRIQLEELKRDLLRAQWGGVTWKFIMVPEPIQNLGVLAAADRFEGYSAERTALLHFIESRGISNVVFVAADIHGTLVNDLEYQFFPGLPPIQTGAFEVTTGSVAFDKPFGPTVLDLAAGIPFPLPDGSVSSLLDVFLAGLGLPPAPVGRQIFDTLPDALRNDALAGLIDSTLAELGYNPLGLEDSPLDAELLEGGYVRLFTYGWTEFDIDRATQILTVTTYGIDPYGLNPNGSPAFDAAIVGRSPEVISKFKVSPR